MSLTWIDKVSCVWDVVAVTGYAIMTLLIYLSSVVPFLSDLASHGKTRIQSSSSPIHPTNNTNRNNAANPSGRSYISSFIHWFNHNEVFLVKKKHFRQFYVVAIICLTTMLYRLIQMQHLQLPIQQINQTQPSSVRFIPSPSPYEKVYSISTILLYVHLLRRLYECTYVHQWRETSMMHIAGYMVGVIHYIWLPHVFVRIPCEQCWKTLFPNSYPSFLFPAREVLDSTYPVQLHKVTRYGWLVLGVCLCLYGQYQQHRHHVLLAILRKPNLRSNSVNPSKDGQYSLPTGGWFQFVTCPHYLAEILIYVSFAILLELEKPILYYGYRHYLVLTWVASNLTLSALINYQWYQKNLPPTIMAGKKAIIPFVL